MRTVANMGFDLGQKVRHAGTGEGGGKAEEAVKRNVALIKKLCHSDKSKKEIEDGLRRLIGSIGNIVNRQGENIDTHEHYAQTDAFLKKINAKNYSRDDRKFILEIATYILQLYRVEKKWQEREKEIERRDGIAGKLRRA